MSLSAIAILHVPPAVAAQAFGSDGPRFDALEDAVCVHLGLDLTSEPEALVAKLQELAGDLLPLHDDPRGVPIYPAKVTLEGQTWEAVAAELGEAADWVIKPAVAPDPMAALLGGMDPSALMGGMDPSALQGMLGGQDPSALLGGMDPSMLQGMLGGQDPSAMLQGVDPAMLQSLMGGGDMGGLMEAAMKMMGQLADTGALADLAKNMGDVAPDLMAQMGQPGQLDTLDMGQLAAQAQAALAADPELEAKLRGALEASEDDGDAEPE